MVSSELDVCPSQFGKVELRLLSPDETTSDFFTTFLSLESACFKWYEDKERNICTGIAYVLNKVEIVKSLDKDHKRKIIRCQVSIKSGPALLEMRMTHGSKLWQLAIDTHFSRCFKPLSKLPAFSYDLDDARYSTLHLSTTAKVVIPGGSTFPFDVPVSINDDVEEKVNVLFPLSRSISHESRLHITSTLMKAQNSLVLEVLRRYHHLENADRQLQRALQKMTERAEAAEKHAESLHATVLHIEEMVPQLSHQLNLLQSSNETKKPHTGSDDEENDYNRSCSGNNTPISFHSGGLGTISWRRKYEATDQLLQQALKELHNCQRELQEKSATYIPPAFQARIEQLSQENHLLREMTGTLRTEIMALNEQLQEIQQAALAQIETLHEQNPVLAEEAATSLRQLYNIHQSPDRYYDDDDDNNEPLSSNHEQQPNSVKVDLSALLSGKSPQSTHYQGQDHSSSPSIFRQPLDLDALSLVSDNQNISEQATPKINLAEVMSQERYDHTDHDVCLLERDNWTNKYHDYLQQSQQQPSAKPASTFSPLHETTTSLGWSFVEDRFISRLYQHYVQVGNVPGSSFNHTHGMSLTKFQKFVKDFQLLSTHSHSAQFTNTSFPGGMDSSKSAFTTAYVSGQPLPNAIFISSASSALDKYLNHSDVSAIFTVASSTRVQEDANQVKLVTLWDQLQSQFSSSTGSNSNNSSTSSTANSGHNNSNSANVQKAAFKVHGGHRSAAEVLDFYHSQHVIYPSNHDIDSTNNSNYLHNNAAFAVGHPGGVGVTVGVVNPASAVLSLSQFRFALTLIAEKLYSRLLSQALQTSANGGMAVSSTPQTVTGKERYQCLRAMLELLLVKNLAPMALSFDLVPQSISCLRVFLVHVQSEAESFVNTLSIHSGLIASVSAHNSGRKQVNWQSIVPDLFEYFHNNFHQIHQSEQDTSRYAMLTELCYAPHLQLLCRLYRTYATTASTNLKHTRATSTKASTAEPLVMEPLGMAEIVHHLYGMEYLLHPFNHLPRVSMSFTQFRSFCLAQGLVPYLIGEHHVYAMYQECVLILQLYHSLFSNNHHAATLNNNTRTNNNNKQKKASGNHSYTQALRTYWQEKRVFPHVALPQWMCHLVAEADKEVVYAQYIRDSETTHWKLPKSVDSSQKNNDMNSSQDAIHKGANTNAPVNMIVSGIDLLGFIVLLGSVAMKIFPHVAPAARLGQLLTLLQQNYDQSLQKNEKGNHPRTNNNQDIMLGQGFNLGGAFHLKKGWI